MTTQKQAADIYSNMQATAGDNADYHAGVRQQLAALRAERVTLDRQQDAYELKAQFAPLSPDEQRLADEANDSAQHSLGAVAWLVLACTVAAIVIGWITWLWATGAVR